MAERLLAAGDRVAGTLRDLSAADDLKAPCCDRLWLGALDLTHTSAIRPTVDAAWAAMDRVDVVVSAAGHRLLGAVEEVTDAQVRHQLDTNLLGSIQLVRAALPPDARARRRPDSGSGARSSNPGAARTGFLIDAR